jgi:hypothetical protein
VTHAGACRRSSIQRQRRRWCTARCRGGGWQRGRGTSHHFTKKEIGSFLGCIVQRRTSVHAPNVVYIGCCVVGPTTHNLGRPHHGIAGDGFGPLDQVLEIKTPTVLRLGLAFGLPWSMGCLIFLYVEGPWAAANTKTGPNTTVVIGKK